MPVNRLIIEEKTMTCNSGTYLGEANVTEQWFIPFLRIQEGEKGRSAFLKHWREYANRADWYGDIFYRRIEGIIFCPGGGDEYASRVATSIVCWFGSNNGLCFLNDALAKTKVNSEVGNYSNEATLLSSWALENRRQYCVNRGVRRLEGILGRSQLIATDFEVAESVMLWLSSDEGRKFVATVFQELGWPVIWEIPNIKILMDDED